MKVLLVCTYFPPHVGGLEVVVQQQAESLTAAGHQVTVLTTKHDASLAQEEAVAGYQIVRIVANNVIERRTDVPFPLIGMKFVHRLWREVCAADIVNIHDVLYTPCCTAAAMAKITGKKLVVTQHVKVVDHDSRIVMRTQRALYRLLGRHVWRQASAIIVYNRRVREFLEEHGVSTNRIAEVRNGIDLRAFAPASPERRRQLREKHELPEGRRLVLFVGRLVPKKGYRELIDAAEDDYEVLLAGSGQHPPEIPSNIRCLGPIRREELVEFYQLADVFVMPSIGEMLTLAMQEAMACGLPVITTDDPRYDLYGIDRTRVRLVDASPLALRDAIREVVDNDELRSAMATYSRSFAESLLDWRENHRTVDHLYIGQPAKASRLTSR